MTKHEFIFSNQRSHRIARHVVFWSIWCFAFNLLFHFPIHVFKGWVTNEPWNTNLQKLGLPLFFIKTLFINSFLGVILPQLLFTYLLINWLLPDYYLKKRNLIVVIMITGGVLIGFFVVAAGFKLSPIIYNHITGVKALVIDFNLLKKLVLVDQFSSLPIVTGLALMIKLIKHWWIKQKESEQLIKEKTKAELQLLKAQIHPHFLFNTLNNIYFFTLTNSLQAPKMIKKLSSLLHYILNECNQPYVLLEKEIKMIEDYMTLEKIRYGSQLKMVVQFPDNYKDIIIAPLLLIPFVENSFKHGASKMFEYPWINLQMTIENNVLHFNISNSRPELGSLPEMHGNIGLTNVNKRLKLLYPESHKLIINDLPDIFLVSLKINLNATTVISIDNEEKKLIKKNAMA